MTYDRNALVIDRLGLRFPGAGWDVLRGVDAPAMAVCGSHETIWDAHQRLRAAGLAPCRHPVPAAELDGPYDLTTVLRFSDGEGRDVLLVRRTPGEPARTALDLMAARRLG